MVLALLDADGLRQLVVAGGDLVDDDPPLAVRVERPGNVVNIMGGIATKTCLGKEKGKNGQTCDQKNTK